MYVYEGVCFGVYAKNAIGIDPSASTVCCILDKYNRTSRHIISWLYKH